MNDELYKKYRPKRLKHVEGQERAVAVLQGLLDGNKVPHTILLSGPSGTGKTTIARIIKRELKCSDADWQEKNCADFRGIDMVRQLRSQVGMAPMDGPCRIFYIDECHRLTGEAQDAFLKLLEDTPSHVYFLLATTEPNKLKKTILTRSTKVQLNSLDMEALQSVLRRVIKREKLDVSEEVIERISDVADGSARDALVILNQVSGLSEDEQLDAVQKASVRQQAIEIARALINPKTKWNQMAKILREVDDEPEGIRYLVLAYATSVLLKGGGKMADRAYLIIDAFSDNFFDSKRAGLVAACYEVLMGA